MGIVGGPNMIKDGLVLALDASDRNSYPGSGTAWRDLSGNEFNCSMSGSISYGNTFPQYFDYANLPNHFIGNNNLTSVISTTITIISWVKVIDTSVRSQIFDKVQFPGSPAGYNLEVGTSSGAWTNTIRFFAVGSTGIGWDPRGVSNAIRQNVPFMASATLNRTTQQFAMYVNDSSVSYTQGGGLITELATDWATGTNTYTLGSSRPDFALDSNMHQYNVLVYNRYLSAAEIVQTYNAQKSRFGL